MLSQISIFQRVSEKVKQRAVAARKVSIAAVDALKDDLAHDWENVSDYFFHDLVELSSVIDNANTVIVDQVPVVDFDDHEDNVVKRQLQNICKDLNKSLKKRLKTLDITKAATKAFADYTWYDPNMFSAKLEANILDITVHIKGPFAKQFSGDDNIRNIVILDITSS